MWYLFFYSRSSPILSLKKVEHDRVVWLIESGKSKKEANASGDILTGERQKQGQPDVAAEDYKLPLVWIDLEMTGN